MTTGFDTVFETVTSITAQALPYNHIGLGQPLANDYVWGRQLGELTINP